MVDPVAKGRPRLTTVNGHARAFTPAKTRNAETAIQYAIRQQLSGVDLLPRTLALALTVTFYRPRPVHLRKSITLPTTKPDLDNYIKTCSDAMNHYVFEDDSQITSIRALKRYCRAGEPPRIELELSEDKEV
jgi:Holliday junction resolvase RusA-like endonuclease